VGTSGEISEYPDTYLNYIREKNDIVNLLSPRVRNDLSNEIQKATDIIRI